MEGLIYYMLVQRHASRVCMFVLCVYVSACVCVMNACVRDLGRASVLALAAVYPCPACSLSSSVDY